MVITQLHTHTFTLLQAVAPQESLTRLSFMCITHLNFQGTTPQSPERLFSDTLYNTVIYKQSLL